MQAIMKTKIFSCMSLVFLLMLSSCQQNDELFQDTKNVGKFLATPVNDFSFDVTTRSFDGNKKLRLSNMDFSDVEVSEELWDNQVPSATRGAVSDDDVSWPDEPLLSMYLADANNGDALLVGNVPLNPTSLAVYDKYDVNKAGTPSAITGSSFFWDTWEKRNYLQDKTVNFYGYYPRPCDMTDWEYRRNSIIEKEFATNGGENWSKLDYVFYQDQTDANLSFFDLMYSIPEEANVAGSHRHGNKNKTQSNNIQMAFKHAFCLLNIEILRGNTYEGDCRITSLSLRGTQVFTAGTLDLIAGKITPSKPDVLNRTISPQKISNGNPFQTTMIVQPTTSSSSGTEVNRMVLSCTIDGAEYSCSLPKLELQGGKKYNLKLTVTPSGTSVFRVWHGATVSVGNETITSCEKKLTIKSDYFTVTHQEGYKVLRVLKNGKVMTPNEKGQYEMDKKEGANTYYNIVACPLENWYGGQDDLRILFDAKWNNKYHTENVQDTETLSWSDLTGNGNDGTLQSFDNVAGESGWGDDCLYFDGVDDIVKYSGNISQNDFTVEVYLYVYPKQVTGKVYERLFAEDERTGYPSLCLKTEKRDSTYGNLSICGNRVVNHGLPNSTNLLGRLVQIDYVYEKEPNKITIYMNGEEVCHQTSNVQFSQSIPEASLGNRIADNTRALKCKYYSFLLYDKKLSTDDMHDNILVNTRRFGAPFQKTE